MKPITSCYLHCTLHGLRLQPVTEQVDVETTYRLGKPPATGLGRGVSGRGNAADPHGYRPGPYVVCSGVTPRPTSLAGSARGSYVPTVSGGVHGGTYHGPPRAWYITNGLTDAEWDVRWCGLGHRAGNGDHDFVLSASQSAYVGSPFFPRVRFTTNGACEGSVCRGSRGLVGFLVFVHQ